jgi:stearoyl-CoA desaturase (delta-9 desaturase)
MFFGFLNLSFWGYVIATLILTQVTIASVTIYLHRCQSHKALNLHPIISHFFRFWLWLTTGMVTAEWVAIHRKHHATTDVEGDPHSPAVEGINKVLWEGAELYRAARKDQSMVEKYSHGTPTDWLERNIYAPQQSKGIWLMFLIDLFLFGVPGITIWAIQMMWIPFFAAGVINGLGHYFGYRNFESKDTSTNIFPLAFWIGGEELHNNHHTFASSAKFSVHWWEFDIGWFYIRLLSLVGLAHVKKLPPKLAFDKSKLTVDIETVRAVIANRFVVMANYYGEVIKPIIQHEKKNLSASKEKQKLFSKAATLLRKEDSFLTSKAKIRLKNVLDTCEQLRVVYAYKQSLQQVWLKTASSQKELIEALQNWCRQAEESGLEVLRDFAVHLKGYVPVYITTEV